MPSIISMYSAEKMNFAPPAVASRIMPDSVARLAA